VSFAIGMSFICHRLRVNGNAKRPTGTISFEEDWYAALALLVELFRSMFAVRTPVSPHKSRSVPELPKRVTTTIAAALDLYRGDLNGTGMDNQPIQRSQRWGCCCCLYPGRTCGGIGGAARIGVNAYRGARSRQLIVASGLLMLGWAMRGGQARPL
jgi:hypothetical protein